MSAGITVTPAPNGGITVSGTSDGTTVDPSTGQTVPAGQTFSFTLPNPSNTVTNGGTNGYYNNGVPGGFYNVVTTTTLYPVKGAVTNITYSPLDNLYHGSYAPVGIYGEELYKNPTGTYTTYLTASNDNPVVFEVIGASSNGPWTIQGGIAGVASPCIVTCLLELNNVIYAGSNVGVFRSTDFGASFEFINGPTNIVQLVSWNGTLIALTYNWDNPQQAFTSTYISYSKYNPAVIYYSNNPSAPWGVLYTKNNNQIGAHVTLPIAVPRPENLLILDDVVIEVSGLSQNNPVLTQLGALSLLSQTPDVANFLTAYNQSVASYTGSVPSGGDGAYPTASIQPVYLGELGGQYYISLQIINGVSLLASTKNLIYSVGVSGVLSYIGAATFDGVTLTTNTDPNNYIRPIYTFDASVETILQNSALSAGTQIITSLGEQLAVPLSPHPGGIGLLPSGANLQGYGPIDPQSTWPVVPNTPIYINYTGPNGRDGGQGTYPIQTKYFSTSGELRLLNGENYGFMFARAYYGTTSYLEYDGYNNPQPALMQSIYKVGSSFPYTTKAALSVSGGFAPIIVSPAAIMTFSTKLGIAYYAAASLVDYYAGTVNWLRAPGVTVSTSNNNSGNKVIKIVYCTPSNDGSKFGKGVFIVLSQAGLFISTDNTASSFSRWYGCPILPTDMAYNNGILLVTNRYSLWFTADGVNWNSLNNPVTAPYLIAHTT